MMCGLPPGDSDWTSVVMTNLLGDLWSRGDPHWEPVFHEPQAKLHLYGKQEAGRAARWDTSTVWPKTPRAHWQATSIRRRLGF